MSKATDYLVEQIRSQDTVIASLLAQQAADRERCFDEGWHAFYLEDERHKQGVRPFTKENPYARQASNDASQHDTSTKG